MMAITVLFENEAWMPPLRAALAAKELPCLDRFMDGGVLDMSDSLEPGVYVNRMSPSSHTRGHQSGVCFVREYLGLLEARGCRIINGSQSFRLEVSKVQQNAAHQSAGILVPPTIAVSGT